MSSSIEKCTEFARTSAGCLRAYSNCFTNRSDNFYDLLARAVFWVVMTGISTFFIYKLWIASNELLEQRMKKFRLEVFPKSDEGSLIYFTGTPEDSHIWVEKLNEFLLREMSSL